MADNSLSLQSPPIKYGIIGGVFYIFAVTVLYVLGVSYYTNPFIKFFLFLIICFFPVRAGLEMRALNGGFIQFSSALFNIFLCFMIIEAFYVIYSWILPTVIDTDLTQKIVDYQILQVEEGKGFMGRELTEEQKQMAIAQIEKAGEQPQMQWILLLLLVYALVDFALSLIAAAFVKKDPGINVPISDSE
ncbi:MAG: DUF4199 domain-containing protein [Bacteroidia bacterium]